MKFRKKPVVIEAITFTELVQHGRDNGANIVDGMPWSLTYNGHGITHENDECYLIPTKEGTMRFTPTDMLITGVQGEIYPCKLDIFAATYDPAAEVAPICGDFAFALARLKAGLKVARAGWNGKGMFVFLVPGSQFTVSRPPLLGIYPEGTPITYRPHIDIKGADGSISTWVPSIGDVMAEDWQIVE